jgi:hypothetical protein
LCFAATESTVKWAEVDNNLPVKELFLKLAQVDELTMVLHRNYIAEVRIFDLRENKERRVNVIAV